MSTLGVNALSIGLPSLVSALLFYGIKFSERTTVRSIQAGLAGALAVLISGILMALFLFTAGEELRATAWLIVSAHLPAALVEGLAAGFIVSFLLKVTPEMIGKGTSYK